MCGGRFLAGMRALASQIRTWGPQAARTHALSEWRVTRQDRLARLTGDETNGYAFARRLFGEFHFQAVIENIERVKITSTSAMRISLATRSLAKGVRGKMSPYPTVANVTVEKYMD